MKLLLIALLGAVILFSGCVESDPLTGKTYEGPGGDIIRFFEDGKMHYTDDEGLGALGTYTIEGNRVYYDARFWTGDAEIQENELHFGLDVYVLVDQ